MILSAIDKMTLLVARRTKHRWILGKFLRNTKGQVSIFFATTIVVLITFMAFIVNIGLFVKAKINLQNAVDAAAWAGASVQARQLSNIAYLNWEMRNVFKEWMFKYYVLGNLSHDTIFEGAAGQADFRIQSVGNNAAEFGRDVYNFPSVCVNFRASAAGDPNICRYYSVPGLPVFPSHGLAGVDQVTKALVNTLASSKMEACARRASLNFMTANLWAYNVVNTGGLNSMAPEIAPERQGAFPAAFELALRIRNLEKFVNDRPETGVCSNQSRAAGNCARTIAELETQNSPGNERVVKAFTSAYRNLGNEADAELKGSFTLTEISPKPFIPDSDKNLSSLLIPEGQNTKFYLDLKLMTVNYATFFTSFTTGTDNRKYQTSAGEAGSGGACDATKIALPVPGYPLGFVKSNRVLTYYAVRGKANWVGLFNPFELGGKGIQITAYAAAKPFGGRIGPMLFDVYSDSSLVKGRSSDIKTPSSGYVMGVDLSEIRDYKGDQVLDTSVDFVSGAPLPVQSGLGGFWLNHPTQAVGGWTQDSALVFSIPNLVYDYPTGSVSEKDSYLTSPDAFDISRPVDGTIAEKAGLYNGTLLNKFRCNLPGLCAGGGGAFGANAVYEGIENVRGPTLYEAYNYLIPSPNTINEEVGVDSFGSTNGIDPQSGSYKFSIYAPLFSDDIDALYKTPNDAVTALNNYLAAQEVAVEKFRNAMNAAAKQISTVNIEGDVTGRAAANGFSDIDFNVPANQGKPSCRSITGKFIFFYLGHIGDLMGDTSNCVDDDGVPILTLSDSMRKYWVDNTDSLGDVYQSSFTVSDSMKSKIFSAYRPGPMHDADPSGVWKRTIGSATLEKMWRNFYSTKFVSINSLTTTGSYNAATSGFPIVSEGNGSHNEINDLTINSGNPAEQGYINSLDIERLGVDISKIFH